MGREYTMGAAKELARGAPGVVPRRGRRKPGRGEEEGESEISRQGKAGHSPLPPPGPHCLPAQDRLEHPRSRTRRIVMSIEKAVGAVAGPERDQSGGGQNKLRCAARGPCGEHRNEEEESQEHMGDGGNRTCLLFEEALECPRSADLGQLPGPLDRDLPSPGIFNYHRFLENWWLIFAVLPLDFLAGKALGQPVTWRF